MSALPADVQDTPNAHPDAVKDLWVECMKASQKHGTLEKQQTIRARTPRERDVARKQNHALTRVVVGMPDGYERIRWDHSGGDAA